MAEGEEEVNYASVVFKVGNNPPPAAKRGEETVYDNVKVQNETKNKDSAGHRRFQHLACCLGILCVILLGGIIGVCVYVATLSHESDPNQSKEFSNLRANNTKLSLENANLTTDNKNLTNQLGNLTQAYHVSESNVTNLSARVQELTTQNQQLETDKKNLTQQIENMTTNWNELNVSRAQWSINSYCLVYDDKKCQPCQRGWRLIGLSCYEFNDPPSSGWKTWAESQEDCSGKNSNLSVAHSVKAAINTESNKGKTYWIGLRVVNKKWEWVDGSVLTESSWIDPPDDGRCAVFFKGNYWYSASCDEKLQWICKKTALSV